MDTGSLISILQESLFVIVVFMSFLIFAMMRGRQGLTNVILGLYFALLLTLKFPYFEILIGGADGPKAQSSIMIMVFITFTILSTMFFGKLMPRDYDEGAFEGFGKKILFALAGTILVMAYSYHALPITELVNPGSPMQALFGPEGGFFWWMLAPAVLLFFL